MKSRALLDFIEQIMSEDYYQYSSVKRQMCSKAFAQGFNDARGKKPYKYDVFNSPREINAYERGRQFAMNYIGPLKTGRKISITAESAMYNLMRSGIII